MRQRSSPARQESAKKMAMGGVTFVQIHHDIKIKPGLHPADFQPDK